MVKVVAVSIAALVVAAAFLVFGLSEARLGKRYEITVAAPAVVPTPDRLERGRHIALTRGCADCHAEDLGGKVFLNQPAIASLFASNLTSGAGGVADRYSDADWDRAIRHGIRPDGTPLVGMPSQDYFGFSDEDLAALVAYLRSVPPVDREQSPGSVGPIGRVLLLAGALPPVAAEVIDHAAPRPEAPPEGATVEYGRYLAAVCAGCHGRDYAGSGRGGPPGAPPAPNLTPHQGGIGIWTEGDFVRALREGIRPDGTAIRGEFMPWSATAQMTDAELSAIWLFLRSLPAAPVPST